MGSTERVTKNKFVQFSYFITDENDEVLEQIDLPLSCVFRRHNRLYDKVELALEGAEVGEEISVELEPSEGAWGDKDPDLTMVEDIENVPPEYHRIGAEVQFQNDQGDFKNFQVTGISDGKITIDGNHPFAGRKVNFHVKVLDVRDATDLELTQGVSSIPGGDTGMLH